MKKQRDFSPPDLHAEAARLLYLCLIPILLALVGAVLYAWCTAGDPMAERILGELLHSIGVSALLAFGGGLLLDFEIRRQE